MPWSQTPVVSLMLAITYAGLLPSVQWTPSAFSHTSGIIPMTTTIHFSGLNTQPASLIHPASDSCLQFCPRTSLLTWWLTFSQVGLRSILILTHWVTVTNFMGLLPFPRSRIYLGTRTLWLGDVILFHLNVGIFRIEL